MGMGCSNVFNTTKFKNIFLIYRKLCSKINEHTILKGIFESYTKLVKAILINMLSIGSVLQIMLHILSNKDYFEDIYSPWQFGF